MKFDSAKELANYINEKFKNKYIVNSYLTSSDKQAVEVGKFKDARVDSSYNFWEGEHIALVNYGKYDSVYISESDAERMLENPNTAYMADGEAFLYDKEPSERSLEFLRDPEDRRNFSVSADRLYEDLDLDQDVLSQLIDYIKTYFIPGREMNSKKWFSNTLSVESIGYNEYLVQSKTTNAFKVINL